VSRGPYSIILILLFLVGCAVQPIPRKEPVPVPLLPPPVQVIPPPAQVLPEPPIKRDPFQAFPQKYRQQALEDERNQDLRKALFDWKVVRCFLPEDREAGRRIESLEQQIGIEAEKHFGKGLDFFRMKSIPSAQKEFLIALAYNPDHTAALDYLKHQLPDPGYIFYETKEGDTLKGIAKGVYKDPEKDFLIAYFGVLGSGGGIKPGRTLKLPVIEPIGVAKPEHREEKLVPAKAPKPEKRRPAQAEVHYKKGVKHFLAQELDQAIEEWEETLQLDPEHPKAKKDLERVRRMRENLKKY